MHVLPLSHGTTFVHYSQKTICVIMTVSPISGLTETFRENAPALHVSSRPPTDLTQIVASETEMTATDVTVMWPTSMPLQRVLGTRSAAQVRHAGIRRPHSCSIATASGNEEEPITRPVRHLRSAGKVCMIPTGREGMPPIENAMRMNNGGGIGTHLATTTNVDQYRHRLLRGDHTRDRRSWIERGTDSTEREKETEIYASVIVNESGIGIWADCHRRRQEGIGTTVTDGVASHSRHRFREWMPRGVLDLAVL